MTQALAASFGSFDKDRELLSIPKGESLSRDAGLNSDELNARSAGLE